MEGSNFYTLLSRRPGSLDCVPVHIPGTPDPLEPAWMLGLALLALFVPASRQKKGRFPRWVVRTNPRRLRAGMLRGPPGLGSPGAWGTEGNSGPVSELATVPKLSLQSA